MLRRLAKEDVRLGMYVHRLEGSWIEHPFWRKSFLLTDPDDLEAIRGSDISGVVIDEEKSIAALAPAPAAPVPPADPEPRAETAPEVAPPRGERVRPARPPRPAAAAPVRCSAAEEMDRAAQTVAQSKRTVAQLLAQARLGRAVDIARVIPVVEDITASIDRNASALVSITRMRSKDEYTYYHSIAVCALMVNLARQLGFDDEGAREAGLAGLLHDFGKIAVPDTLLKKPDSLTSIEFGLVRQHVERGHQLLRSNGYSDAVCDACLHHHERIDGTGYPHGLKGKEIGLHARMTAVCDVYDAITSRRPYREAAGPAESLASMFKWTGHFDPDVLAAFIRSIGIYPVGSLVRLKSDRLALVIDQAKDDSMRPTVRIFFSIAGRARVPAVDLDLSAEGVDDAIVSREDPVKWGFSNWESRWTALIRAAPVEAAAA